MRSSSRRRRSTSTSAATAATSCGACTTTTSNANQTWYEALNDTPGRVGPPIERPPGDIRQYWRDWLERDGYPFWSFWENVRTWWADPRPAERDARALREPEARHAGRDAPHRGVPRHSHRRSDAGSDPRVLLVRLDEAERHQERAARRRLLGRRRPGLHQQGRQRPLDGRPDGGGIRGVRSARDRELGPDCARWLATGQG